MGLPNNGPIPLKSPAMTPFSQDVPISLLSCARGLEIGGYPCFLYFFVSHLFCNMLRLAFVSPTLPKLFLRMSSVASLAKSSGYVFSFRVDATDHFFEPSFFSFKKHTVLSLFTYYFSLVPRLSPFSVQSSNAVLPQSQP